MALMLQNHPLNYLKFNNNLNFRLNINTNSTVTWANKLEKIHKLALPVAARGAINDTIFDLKTKTMPQEAESTFTIRKKNFFTANSKFIKAEGLVLKGMKGKVGFYQNKLVDAPTNYSVLDLQKQEAGGNIGGKSLIPLPQARAGGKGNVRPNYRLKEIHKHNIVKTDNQKGKTKAERFVQAVLKAGVNGFVIGGVNSGENFLWKVNELNRFSSSHKTVHFNLSRLYSVSKGRSVHVEQTSFMKNASEKSHEKTGAFFIKQAQRQLKKYWDK